MSESLVVPVRTWLAAPMDHDVSEAIDRLRRVPDVQQIAVMPDVHLASDVCIGVAVATTNLIYALEESPTADWSWQTPRYSLTNQTTSCRLALMLDSRIRRLLDAYPAIFLACHRKHLREDESGERITEHQASVLDHLHATHPITVSKLAEHMGVSRSTMSITVARLIRGGYITRRHDIKDRRSVGLTLTAAGARIKEQNTVLDPDLVQEMFGFMSAAELEAALRAIERLAGSARALLRRRSRGDVR